MKKFPGVNISLRRSFGVKIYARSTLKLKESGSSSHFLSPPLVSLSRKWLGTKEGTKGQKTFIKL